MFKYCLQFWQRRKNYLFAKFSIPVCLSKTKISCEEALLALVPHCLIWIRSRFQDSVADPDSHHLAGSRIFYADPDPRLQNWQLIHLSSVKSIVNKFKYRYIYANF
jgi:hypothetical protein